jgi:hypothetical protein
MRGAIVESGSPAASPFGCGAWLAVALQEQERRAVISRPRASERRAAERLAEPCIDRDACADWLAAAPTRDRREASR